MEDSDFITMFQQIEVIASRRNVSADVIDPTIYTNIDAQARKSCPFPDAILARGRSLVRAYTPPA
jgi:hypothetical protein